MERKTKKMAETELEISLAMKTLDALSTRRQELEEFKPASAEGKQAKDEAINQFGNEMSETRVKLGQLRNRLEVETVEMLAGKDTEFAEPTPADALRSA